MKPFKIRLDSSPLLHFEAHSDLQFTADCVLLSTAPTFPETAVGSETCQDSTLFLSLQKLNQQSLPAEKTVSSEK